MKLRTAKDDNFNKFCNLDSYFNLKKSSAAGFLSRFFCKFLSAFMLVNVAAFLLICHEIKRSQTIVLADLHLFCKVFIIPLKRCQDLLS